ncbi:integration host factor, actinobacterial type [Streptomyces sp. TX20-6-3]|uniref:integration host factor, actinobacterial type n=1 Tax=Streptomyces sp. TX20-6-3 TaxID=3028705 RepID=UPI0034DEC32E
MPLQELTTSDRARALERGIALRRERARILNDVRSGHTSIGEVLSRSDYTVGRIRVKNLLKALPGIGEVRSRDLLKELGIAEQRRVQGLGVRQRRRILEMFPHGESAR